MHTRFLGYSISQQTVNQCLSRFLNDGESIKQRIRFFSPSATCLSIQTEYTVRQNYVLAGVLEIVLQVSPDRQLFGFTLTQAPYVRISGPLRGTSHSSPFSKSQVSRSSHGDRLTRAWKLTVTDLLHRRTQDEVNSGR
jgi:hypothetical protein